MINTTNIFDYEDVQLIPNKCIVSSRSECDTHVKLGKRTFRLPVVPANMQTIIDEELAEKLSSGNASYYNKGYTSTSHTPIRNFFTTRPVRTVINVPKGSNMYFSDNDKESEIILPRGAKFDIISAKETHGAILLEMKYIPSKEG